MVTSIKYYKTSRFLIFQYFAKIIVGGGRWRWRRTTGKRRLGKALVDSRHAMWGSSLPWGRGERLHMPVEGRSRRSDTEWQRRSPWSVAAGKARYGGVSNKYFRTHHLLRTTPRSMCSTSPFPSRCQVIDMLPKAMCLRLSYRHTACIAAPLTT
jgi:hypothetical protein